MSLTMLRLGRLLLAFLVCCQAANVAETKLRRRLAKVSRRVEVAARGFDALRFAASGEAAEVRDSARASFQELQPSAADAGRALQDRFEALRQLSSELAQAPGVELEAAMAAHTDDLEALAADLEAHLALTREGVASVLPVDSQQRFADAAMIQEVRSAAAAGVAELTEAARSKPGADPSALSMARRLGARLARVADPDVIAGDPNEALDQIRAVESEARSGLAKLQRASESGFASSASSSDLRQGGDGCNEAQVVAAASRFDKAVRSFRGSILKAMLPPEVENLHRIVHTMEVKKSTLLRDLTEGGGHSAYGGEGGATRCDEYFAGVGQIEKDLGHYKTQAERERGARRRKGRRRKGGVGESLPGPDDGGGAGGPRAQISALPAPGRQQQGMGRPALDVRGFA